MLDYTKFFFLLFRCMWVENNNGVKVNELEFTLVDLNKEGHKENTFILAIYDRNLARRSSNPEN